MSNYCRTTFSVGDAVVRAVAMQCSGCDNFFMVPGGDVYEDPKCCPFCCVKFDSDPVDADLSGEINALLDCGDDEEAP